MATRFQAQDQWILCRLGERLFGFPSGLVQEMLAIPPVRTVPQLPYHVRGVINLRGRVIPMIDLRVRLGLPPAEQVMQQTIQEVEGYEQAHKEWLTDLEECVREGREFTRAISPHDCACGHWLDTFNSDNIVLTAAVRKMLDPHAMIHAVAVEVLKLVREGNEEMALKRIEQARRAELTQVIRLFGELKTAVPEAYRETAVVLEGAGAVYAVSVDQVASVEHLKQGTLADLPELATAGVNGQVSGLARRTKDDGLVLILDTDKILDESFSREILEADLEPDPVAP